MSDDPRYIVIETDIVRVPFYLLPSGWWKCDEFFVYGPYYMRPHDGSSRSNIEKSLRASVELAEEILISKQKRLVNA